MAELRPPTAEGIFLISFRDLRPKFVGTQHFFCFGLLYPDRAMLKVGVLLQTFVRTNAELHSSTGAVQSALSFHLAHGALGAGSSAVSGSSSKLMKMAM